MSPPSMSTQRVYTTFVRLLLSSDGKHVKAFGEGYCLCQGGALGDCTHVAAALFTLQDLVYLAGRVPGEKSRILSCTERLQNLLYAAALLKDVYSLTSSLLPLARSCVICEMDIFWPAKRAAWRST